MGRHRDVPEGGEPFDYHAISSNPQHLGTGSDGLLRWTCSPRAFERPTAGKCQESFVVEDVLLVDRDELQEPRVPAGWQWSERAGIVSYCCPEHKIPGASTVDERAP